MKKKITLILPSLHSGGMERVMSILANQFIKYDDIQVDLILFSANPKLFYQIDKKVKIHTNQSKKKWNKIILFFQTIWFIRKRVSEISPDAILSFGTQWNNIVLLALLGTKHKVFVSDRGSPNRVYAFPQELLKSILYPRASGIIAQTSISENVTRKRFRNANIITIGNPIRLVEDNHQKVNQILSVGRLIKSKHHDRLIQIFNSLKNAEDWQLVIVGGNALRQSNYNKLNQLVNTLNLQGRVVLTGEQSSVDEYYTSSKIFAFTSSIEGFPNVVGEALSCGLPVVSYDCVAGPSEMIKNNFNGFLVPPFDDSMFLEKLQYLIDHPAERMRMSNNAKDIRIHFSEEVISRKFLSFLTAGSPSNKSCY